MADNVTTVPPPPRLPADLQLTAGDLDGLPERARAATLLGASRKWAERAHAAEQRERRVRGTRRTVGIAALLVGSVVGWLAEEGATWLGRLLGL